MERSGSELILANLFGDWIFGGKFQSSVSSLLSIIGVGGLVLYTVLISYIALAGLMKASSRGGVRGWHPAWVPFRVVMSLLLLLPLYSGAHWGAAQIGMLEIARKGAQFGDWVVEKVTDKIFLSRYYSDPNFQIGRNYQAASSFVMQTVKAAACVKANQELNNPLNLTSGKRGYDEWLRQITTRCGIDYAYFSGGYKATPPASERDVFAPKQEGYTPLPWAKERERLMRQQEYVVRRTVVEHNKVWFQAILNHVWGTWKMDGKSAHALFFGAKGIMALIMAYDNQLQNAVKKALAGHYKKYAELYAKDLASKGWFFVFATQRDLMRQAAATNAAIQSSIEGMTPYPKLPDAMSADRNQQEIVLALSQIDEEEQGFLAEIKAWISGGEKLFSDLTDGAQKYVTHMTRDVLGLEQIKRITDSGVDPLLMLHDAGSKLVTFGGWSLVGGYGGDLVGLGASRWGGVYGKGIGGLLDHLTEILKPIALVLMLVGGILMLLSLMPVLYGISALMIWITYVAQSFVATPFWVAAHAAPEGDDHTSRLAAKGYNNVLFILLYPALAVAGFFVAAKISQVVLPVGLKIAIGGLWGDLDEPLVWASITNMVFLLIGLLVVCWYGVTMSYQLIEGMPVAVLGWISVSEPGLNPFANLHNSASRVIGGMVASHGPGAVRAGYRGFKGGVARALGDLGKIRSAFESTKESPSIRNDR